MTVPKRSGNEIITYMSVCSKDRGEAARLEVSGNFQKVSAKVQNDIIDYEKF